LTPQFRRRHEHDLERLSDEDLLAYVAAARAAGHNDAAIVALRILVFGYYDLVRGRVRLRSMPETPSDVIDEMAAAAITRSVGAAFDGSLMGQFVNWLHTITDRTVADHFRRGARRPTEVPLPDESDAERDGSALAAPDGLEALDVAIDLHAAVDAVLAELNPTHRRVVVLFIWDDVAAGQIAAQVGDGMTEANVNQIVSRFRVSLRTELDRRDTGT
jgi:RNA polymerase sigma factor (sigma-70 family)